MSEISKNAGYVFDIQRMSLHDGPGIRTTVFLKGCNLRCYWCHNPESWKKEPEIRYYPAKCIGCRACEYVCKYNAHKFNNNEHEFIRENCVVCGKCTTVCNSGSLTLVGKKMTVEMVFKIVKRDIPFYKNSGGGVTLSGGEPLVQPDFTLELLKRFKQEGIHTAIESAFCVKWDLIKSILEFVDFFLVDIKTADPAKHREATGVSNELIINNIKKLDSTGAKYCLRVPVIPGFNDNIESIEDIYNYVLKDLKNINYLELMPYHTYGESKYPAMGIERKYDTLEPPKKELLEKLAKQISKYNISVKY